MIIDLIIITVAVGLSTWGSLSWWPVAQWFDFYKPIVLLLSFYLGGMIVWFISIDFIGKIFSLNPKKHDMGFLPRFFVRDVMRYICNHALCSVKVVGKDKLPSKTRYLFVSNHIGNFDPMIAYAYLHDDLAFITKPVNMKMPLGKYFLPLVHFQSIIREDPLQSLQVMKNSEELIKNDVTSIAVYPEGTRHKDGVLGDFHEGVFSIATRSKCPIVISSIKGSNMITKNLPFKITRVKLNIISVIYPESFEGKTVKTISEEVKEIISNDLGIK